MKALILLPCLLIIVAFFATVTALMQDRLRPQLNHRDDLPQRAPEPDSLPQNHLNQNRLHKLIINRKESAVYDQLAKQNAIRNEIDYGSFKLVEVDEIAVGGGAALQATRKTQSDQQKMSGPQAYIR